MKLARAAALGAAFAAAPPSAAWCQERLGLACDSDRLGASTAITYVDSSPTFRVADALRECGPTPGPWSSVLFATETDAASVQASADVASEADDVLRVHMAASLLVDDGPLDFASVAVGAEAEAFFTAPDGGADVPADVVLEIEREGRLDGEVLRLRVTGPSVDSSEDLEERPDGTTRLPLRLEPGAEYAARVTSAGTRVDSGSASRSLRLHVELVSVPEPSGPWLVATGSLALAAVRALRRSSSR